MEQRITENGFTFDTCVVINILENRNFGDMLSCKLGLAESTAHLSEQARVEIRRKGHDVDDAVKQIQKLMGANVVYGMITDEMKDDAIYLRTKCPTLHGGDDQILAYARATGTTLITCDKEFIQAAKMIYTQVINPNILACDPIRVKKKSKMQRIVDKAIYKPQTVKTITRSFVLKPKQKIVWSSFQ